MVEAHEFQRQLDGMQSLPRQRLREPHGGDGAGGQKLQFSVGGDQLAKCRATQSAKVATQNTLRDEMDYDQLRRATLINRRSARSRVAPDEGKASGPNADDSAGDDPYIPGETIYLFKDGS